MEGTGREQSGVVRFLTHHGRRRGGAWRRGGELAAPGGEGDEQFAKTPWDLFSLYFLLFLPL